MLPPRTEDEERGMKLCEELFDFGMDYETGKPYKELTEEEKRLINLGWKRFNDEEFDGTDYQIKDKYSRIV